MFFSWLFVYFFHGIVTVMDFKGFSWDGLMDFQWDVHVFFFKKKVFFMELKTKTCIICSNNG